MWKKIAEFLEGCCGKKKADRQVRARRRWEEIAAEDEVAIGALPPANLKESGYAGEYRTDKSETEVKRKQMNITLKAFEYDRLVLMATRRRLPPATFARALLIEKLEELDVDESS